MWIPLRWLKNIGFNDSSQSRSQRFRNTFLYVFSCFWDSFLFQSMRTCTHKRWGGSRALHTRCKRAFAQIIHNYITRINITSPSTSTVYIVPLFHFKMYVKPLSLWNVKLRQLLCFCRHYSFSLSLIHTHTHTFSLSAAIKTKDSNGAKVYSNRVRNLRQY